MADLFDAGFLEGKSHALCLGPTEEIPYLKQQERLTFARCGIVDPLSLTDYVAHGGYRGLQRALSSDAWSRSSPKSPTPDCADAAALAFRPGSSGKRCWALSPIRNTSAAMLTKAIAAPTPIA